MALNFNDIATKKLDQVERPELPPVATYRWRVTKIPESTTTNDGKWDIVNFSVRAVECLDEIDPADYKGEVTNIVQSIRFMFNKEDESEFEKSLYRLRTFLEKHLLCSDGDMSIGQALNASVNAECLGTIAWKQDKNDPEVMHANISRTAPVD